MITLKFFMFCGTIRLKRRYRLAQGAGSAKAAGNREIRHEVGMTDQRRPRALIVEDEPLVLLDLEETLTQLGYLVVDKARDLVKGLILARELDIDVAILDVNLAGLSSGKIADLLQERGVPFLLISGYTEAGIPERHRNSLRIAKPYESVTLRRALHSLLGEKAPANI
jgi:CheY-like chemotaxis protein